MKKRGFCSFLKKRDDDKAQQSSQKGVTFIYFITLDDSRPNLSLAKVGLGTENLKGSFCSRIAFWSASSILGWAKIINQLMTHTHTQAFCKEDRRWHIAITNTNCITYRNSHFIWKCKKIPSFSTESKGF